MESQGVEKLVLETGVQLRDRDRVKKNRKIFPTGCANLNELLDGGIRSRELTELAGRCGTGKSQICLTFAVSALEQNNSGRILYIDTTGSFTAFRLTEIVLLRNLHFTEKPLEKFMSRFLVARVYSQAELMKILDVIEANTDNVLDDLVAIIVDHVTSILNHAVRSDVCTGFHQMFAAGRRLKALAVRYDLAVIVVNSAIERTVKCGDGEVMVAALGKWWSTLANTRLMLTRVSKEKESAFVLAKLEKSLSVKVLNATTTVEIIRKGVVTPTTSEYTTNSAKRPVTPVY